MLLRNPFLYEYLLTGFLLLQILVQTFIPTAIIIPVFVLIFYLKYKKEGFKMTFPLFMFAEGALLYFSNIFVQLLIVVLLYLTLDRFPILKCPEPTGPYKVGFKEVQVGRDLDLSFYYPTLETTQDAIVYEGSELTRRNFEGARLWFNIYIPYIVPWRIHEITFSFFERLYLGVQKDAKIISAEPNSKFPIIVFSHGIACSKNLYTIFTKEWASRGYIVVCVDHDEEIYCDWKYPEHIVEAKTPLLQARKKAVVNTLDYICNEEIIKGLLGAHVQLDRNRVFMAGHSFGGGTSASVVSEDDRITAGVILLDPFMNPCQEKVFEQKTRLPMICIRSEEYDKISPIRESALRFIKANTENIVSGYFKNSYHCTQCDLILYLPVELKLWEMNGSLKDIGTKIDYHRKMVNIFLDKMSETSKNRKEHCKELTQEVRNELEAYWATLDKDQGLFYRDN